MKRDYVFSILMSLTHRTEFSGYEDCDRQCLITATVCLGQLSLLLSVGWK